MGNFTTQITDANIISELPDVSILGSLYDDATTSAELVSTFSSVTFRKKFQTLLKFQMSEDSRTSLYNTLKQAYIEYETANGKTVTESGGNVFVDDRLVALAVDRFADGLFVDETFATAFFTSEVLDAVFSSGDEAFIEDILNVGKFWDKLLTTTDAISHMEANYSDVIDNAVKTIEVAYVKYIAYKAGVDVSRYKSIEYLAEDTSVMDAISSSAEAMAIERDSKFGIKSRLMYLFTSSSIEDIADNEENIVALDQDAQLRSIVVDFDALAVLPQGSLMRQYILNNDGRFGAIASERLGIETTVSLSNIFYDETFSDEKSAFVRDEALVELLFESDLYDNFKTQFHDAFVSINSTGQRWSFKVNASANTLTGHTVDDEFIAKKLSLSLDSFSQTKLGSVSNAAGIENAIFVPYTFIDESAMAVDLQHNVVFTNPDNYNLYNEFADVAVETVIGANGHIMGITKDGDVISSKFVTQLNLSTEDIENISITEDNIFIKTAQTFHSIGNLGADKNDIIGNLVINKDDLVKAAMFNGTVLALGTDNAIKVVDAGGVTDYAAGSGIAATDMYVIDGRLVVLDSANELHEIKSDGTTAVIATDVSSLEYAQDAVIATVSGTEMAIFNTGSQWLQYDFNVNQI